MNGICRSCGCTETAAAADAKEIGLLGDFFAGLYTCCQVVQWADEQWLAWHEASQEDAEARGIDERLRDVLLVSQDVEPEAAQVPLDVRKIDL